MACFLVPATEAVVTTIVEKRMSKTESGDGAGNSAGKCALTWGRKLRWLTYMLWGGTLLLTFEHIWHGEVLPWFPFLAGAQSATSAAAMLREMATVGAGMALLVTTVWVVMVVVAEQIVHRPLPQAA